MGRRGKAGRSVCVCVFHTHIYACTCVCIGVDWTKQSGLADIMNKDQCSQVLLAHLAATVSSWNQRETCRRAGLLRAVSTRRQRTRSQWQGGPGPWVGCHTPGRRLSLSNGERKAAETGGMTQECRAVTGPRNQVRGADSLFEPRC